MANPRVVLNLRGINAVMTSREATAELARRGHRIKQAAGDDFEMVVKPHKWTARVFIQPANARGARQEARDKRLSRAVDAGR